MSPLLTCRRCHLLFAIDTKTVTHTKTCRKLFQAPMRVELVKISKNQMTIRAFVPFILSVRQFMNFHVLKLRETLPAHIALEYFPSSMRLLVFIHRAVLYEGFGAFVALQRLPV